MFSVPKDVLINYLSSEFKIKNTSDPDEIRINSIYEKNYKYKCYINTSTFKFIDFISGHQGSVFNLIKDHENLNSVKDVCWFLMKNYSNGENFLEFQQDQENIKNNSQIIEEFLQVDNPIWFHQKEKIDKIGRNALRYLLDRNIPIQEIRKMGFVSNPNSKFYNRLIIPFYENGILVYALARSLDPNEKLRYLNISGLSSKDYIFNYDKLEDTIIFCEGVFDAMSLTEQSAVPLLGATLSKKQIEKIYKKVNLKTAIFVPDNDETGRKTLEKNIQILSTYAPTPPEILIFNLPDGSKDLNEMLTKTGKDFILKKECEKYSKIKWKEFNF